MDTRKAVEKALISTSCVSLIGKELHLQAKKVGLTHKVCTLSGEVAEIPEHFDGKFYYERWSDWLFAKRYLDEASEIEYSKVRDHVFHITW